MLSRGVALEMGLAESGPSHKAGYAISVNPSLLSRQNRPPKPLAVVSPRPVPESGA
jgi:hypothetical protein